MVYILNSEAIYGLPTCYILPFVSRIKIKKWTMHREKKKQKKQTSIFNKRIRRRWNEWGLYIACALNLRLIIFPLSLLRAPREVSECFRRRVSKLAGEEEGARDRAESPLPGRGQRAVRSVAFVSQADRGNDRAFVLCFANAPADLFLFLRPLTCP